MQQLKQIENALIVEGGIINLTTKRLKNGDLVFEWLESRDDADQLIINRFVPPIGRADLRSIIEDGQYDPGTVFEATIGKVCSVKSNGLNLTRTVIVDDINENPVEIIRPQVGPWQIGQITKALVCRNNKTNKDLMLKPLDAPEYFTFFNLSQADLERVNNLSKESDGWDIKIRDGYLGKTNGAGKRVCVLSCSLVGDRPSRRRIFGDYYTGDDIIVRIECVSGEPRISGCHHWGKEVFFDIDKKSEGYKEMKSLVSKSKQGDLLLMNLAGGCTVGYASICIFGTVQKVTKEVLKKFKAA